MESLDPVSRDKDTAVALAGAVTPGENFLRRGPRLVGLNQGPPRSGSPDWSPAATGYPRRGHQPDAVPLKVRDGTAGGPDFDLTPVGGPRIHVPRLDRPAEVPVSSVSPRTVGGRHRRRPGHAPSAADLPEEPAHRAPRRSWSPRSTRASLRSVVNNSACSDNTLVKIERATAIRSAIWELTSE